MCGYLDGTFHDAAHCDLDFAQLESSGILSVIDGVTTADKLCGVIQGNYKGTVCTVNLEDAGTGDVEAKMVSCGELQGEWKENQCVLKDPKNVE
ncbi:hypothetical protein BU23DRAFT_559032 [Bimuria novae-zelandiae CBS 107.79]|uniref:Uncharacterized protein n=1 Tax=Bimuria novae-zelandiae CBS 107.79 TaxID=1447943 RepID=A0A6A5UYD4_9PLEO|nr:hypothetical protein BU23DRAFT_559032 [Bimuria novae-zelandiae CBS 107.79]